MPDGVEESTEERSNIIDYIFDWIQCIVFAIVLVIAIFTFIGKPMEVNQISMNPTLYEGDRLVVSSLMYTPENGDIIVFSKLSYEDATPLVKRIIASGGQTIDIDPTRGTVTVDGEILDEPYINELTQTVYEIGFPLTVPEGYVFAMGDNRNHSKDSRSAEVGFVDTREILGEVKALILPITHFEIF